MRRHYFSILVGVGEVRETFPPWVDGIVAKLPVLNENFPKLCLRLLDRYIGLFVLISVAFCSDSTQALRYMRMQLRCTTTYEIVF